MSLSHDNGQKIGPDRQSRNLLAFLIWGIIAIQIIIALVAYPHLPDRVPIHWDAQGQVNGYGSKWINTLLFPGMSIGMYVLLHGLMAISPRLGNRGDTEGNARLVDVLLAGILLFLLLVQSVVTAIALGISIDLGLALNLAVGVLYIFIGNYLGKLRRNFWMGIRTPWTITSDVVWERTHRLGGWLFVACGLLAIPSSFVPALRLWGVVGPILVVAVFLVVYSYICYRQNERDGNQPASHPFEPEG